jgi:hypothetical protein
MRPPRGTSARHEITRVRGRARNLERRFIDVGDTDLTETDPVIGIISRDGAAGAMSITSGPLNATTTLIQHNNIGEEAGVDCDIVSTPSRIVIVTPGLYVVSSSLVDLDSGSDDYGLALGHAFNARSAVWVPAEVVRRVIGGGAVPHTMSFLLFDEGDYITQVVGQNSGSTQTHVYLAVLKVVRIPGSITSADVLSEIDGGSL